MAGKKYEIDMCNGPILKKVLMFAIPLACSNVLQLLFNAVDIIVVGQYVGDEALAAVGATTHIVNLFISLFMGLSVGVNVLVAQNYGAKDEKGIGRAVHTSVAISLLCGIILACVGVLFAPGILRLTKVPEEVLPLSIIYLRVYFLGMPVIILYNFGAAVLRAIGDTKRPLTYLTIAGFLNVILNLFFVLVLKLSVMGVALATTLSQVFSACMVLRCMMTQEGGFCLSLREVKIHKKELKRILHVGIPAGIQSSFFSISNVVVQTAVNSFGAVVVAGSSAAANIGGFIQKALDSFSEASVSFVGQNVGAQKYQRLNRIVLVTLGCVITLGTITAAICYFGGPWILSIYTDSPDAIAAGMIRLKYIGCFYVLSGIMGVLIGAIRGMRSAIIPLITSLLGTCILRIGWLQTVCQMERFHTIEMVYIIYPISWLLTIIAHLITFIFVKRKLVKTSKL